MAMKPATGLARLLRRTARRTRLVTAVAGALRSAALLLVIALGLLLLDAWRPWNPGQLAGGRLAIVVVAMLLLVWVVVRAGRERLDPRRTARRIETRLGISHSRLVNAVELAPRGAVLGSVELAGLAVDEGERFAGELAGQKIVSVRPVWRATRELGTVLLIAAGIAAWRPGVFTAGVPRWLAPRSDHPPYTAVTFAVAVSPDPVGEGGRAGISATLGGEDIPGQADLIWIGGEKVRLPMARVRPGEFVLNVESAAESRAFYIDTPGGRSRQFVMRVARKGEGSPAEEGLRGVIERAEAVAKRARDLMEESGGGSASTKPRVDNGQVAGVDAVRRGAAGVAREAAARARVPSVSASEAAMRRAVGEVGGAADELSRAAAGLAAALRSGDAAAITEALRGFERAGGRLGQMAAAATKAGNKPAGGQNGLSGKGTALQGKSDGRGEGAGVGDGPSETVRTTSGRHSESVDAGPASNGSGAGSDLEGVPLPYREAAAAYFRRLAGEAR
jgi:hypothetical protein